MIFTPMLQALLNTTHILQDAIALVRALGYDEFANILTQRMLDAQENIYGSDPTEQNGGNTQ